MSQTYNPLVSVIIPVYNGEDTISKAIHSVIEQTYQNIEIIVVNNGSNDDTRNIIQAIAHYDERVRYIESDKGRSRARNKGLTVSKGKYIGFLDADDILKKDHIKRAVLSLEKEEDTFAYIEDAEFVDSAGTVVKTKTNINTTNLKINNPFVISAVVFRNQNISYFIDSLEHNEDWLFWLQNFDNKKISYASGVYGVEICITGTNTMADLENMLGSEIIVHAYAKNNLSFIKQIKLILVFELSKYFDSITMRNLIKSQFFMAYSMSIYVMKLPVLGSILKKTLRTKINEIRRNSVY